MPISRNILVRASEMLRDRDQTRWRFAELAGWLNDGMRQLVMAKPSASSRSIILQMVQGTRQTLDPTLTPSPIQLLDVNRNLKSASDPRIGGRRVTKVSRAMLDENYPDWHDSSVLAQTAIVKHFTFDENNPLEFYVYPGNTGIGVVEAVVSVLPPAMTYSGNEALIDSYSANIDLPAMYETPLIDYVLYRAYAKDDVAQNAGKAQFHFQAFATAVGLRQQVEVATSPNAPKA